MKKLASFFPLTVAAIVGCGLCCLPFLIPLIATTTGVSILSISNNEILCGSILLVATMLGAGLWFKKKKNACDLPVENKAE